MAGEVALYQQAPEFELLDYQARPHRLSDYRGTKHVYLVFNRGFT